MFQMLNDLSYYMNLKQCVHVNRLIINVVEDKNIVTGILSYNFIIICRLQTEPHSTAWTQPRTMFMAEKQPFTCRARTSLPRSPISIKKKISPSKTPSKTLHLPLCLPHRYKHPENDHHGKMHSYLAWDEDTGLTAFTQTYRSRTSHLRGSFLFHRQLLAMFVIFRGAGNNFNL